MKYNGISALVVGMKRSGIASCRVKAFVREGASVTAADLKALDELPEAHVVLDRLHVPFALQTPAEFEAAELIVLSPDVPADLAPVEAARARGARAIGEIEPRRAVPQRPQYRDHRVQRQDHHHQPDRPHPARIRRPRAGGRQHRHARDNERSPPRADDAAMERAFELSSFQLETIFEFRAPPPLRSLSSPHAESSRPATATFENSTPPPKGGIFAHATRGEDHAVLNADDLGQRSRIPCASTGGPSIGLSSEHVHGGDVRAYPGTQRRPIIPRWLAARCPLLH